MLSVSAYLQRGLQFQLPAPAIFASGVVVFWPSCVAYRMLVP